MGWGEGERPTQYLHGASSSVFHRLNRPLRTGTMGDVGAGD